MSTAAESHTSAARRPIPISRIAVGIDGSPQGLDAAVLGATLARVAGADLLLVTVHPQPIFVLPTNMNWASEEREAAYALSDIRDELAPAARTVVETDLSVARALHRVVEREHRDLLVLGSSRHAASGRVRIGKHARKLLSSVHCAVAVAPKGRRDRDLAPPKRIGVTCQGGLESDPALQLAEAVAAGSGAELTVIGPESVSGRPADRLLELSREVDLLVIGSRRWGAIARRLLGSTGEALMHDASCPVVVVPRPPPHRRGHGVPASHSTTAATMRSTG